MTPAQNALYWREIGAWSRARKARGMPVDNAARHAAHVKALGRDKSHTAFLNPEFDKVLAVLRAESRPDDLDAQLRQIDQPEQRFSKLLERARDLAGSCNIKLGLVGSYLDGMAMKIFRVPQYHKLDERRLAQLCGILQRRVAQIKRKNAPVVANDNPF